MLSFSFSLSPSRSSPQLPDTYESIDDTFFSADVGDDDDISAKAMRRPLMPQGCTNPDTELQHFTRNFAQRYGPIHPLFYVGPLSAAVKEATSGSASSGTVSHEHQGLIVVFSSKWACMTQGMVLVGLVST